MYAARPEIGHRPPDLTMAVHAEVILRDARRVHRRAHQYSSEDKALDLRIRRQSACHSRTPARVFVMLAICGARRIGAIAGGPMPSACFRGASSLTLVEASTASRGLGTRN